MLLIGNNSKDLRFLWGNNDPTSNNNLSSWTIDMHMWKGASHDTVQSYWWMIGVRKVDSTPDKLLDKATL